MSNTRNLADLLDSGGDIKSSALDNVPATDISGKLDTSGGTLTGTLTMESTDAGSTAAPELILYRNSASPADGDYLGQVQFKGENDNGGSEIYAKVTGKITDASNGTEDGLIETAIKGNGSFTIVSRQKSDELQLLNGVNLNVDGNITVGGTVDGVDIQTLNTTAGAALPKAGGTMTGTIAGFTSTGIDDNADATAITIDSSERIGIGTASPNARLHVYNANDHTRLKVECAQNSGQAWMFQSRNNGEFWIRNDSGSGTNPVVIGSDGRVAISQTGNATAMQVSTSVAAETTAIFQGGGTGAVDVVDVRDSGGNSKFKVRQNGNVGIGTSSPTNPLHITGASGDIVSDISNGTLLQIDGGSISTTNHGVGLAFVRTGSQLGFIKAARENTSNEAGFLSFASQTSGGTHPERMRIQSDGSLLVGTTDGGSSGAGDIVASAIFLGGNQAANELDDYEEGNWTVTSSDSASGFYQAAHYVKVGGIVHVRAYFGDIGGGTTFAGLPFAAESSTGLTIHQMYQVNWPSSAKQLTSYVSGSNIYFRWQTDTGVGAALSSTDTAHSSCTFGIAGTYKTTA